MAKDWQKDWALFQQQKGRVPNKDEAFYYGMFGKFPEPSWIPWGLKIFLYAAGAVGVVSLVYWGGKSLGTKLFS